MTRIIRLISILALTCLTACGAGVQQRSGGGGLAQQQQPLILELLLIGALADADGESGGGSKSSDSGLGTGAVLLGTAVIAAGAYLIVSNSSAVDGSDPEVAPAPTFKHAPNVGTPDFVRAALDAPPGL